MKRILFIIILFLSCQVFAQTDTAFWFAPPDLSDTFGATPVRLVFHTYDQPATVTVEQPANSAFPTYNFTMGAHGVSTYDLSSVVDLIETKPINTVLNRGFYIHSTAPITCYYQSTSNNRETYTLKGSNALGTRFWANPPYSREDLTLDRNIGKSIEIIATQDSTTISITINEICVYNMGSMGEVEEICDTVIEIFQGGINDDSTFQIVLNRGQSYALRTVNYDTYTDEVEIKSTKPISVNVTSDQCVSGVDSAVYNLAGEQLVPTSHFGNRYAIIQIPGSYSSSRPVGTIYSHYPNMSSDYSSSTYYWDKRHFGLNQQTNLYYQMAYTVVPHLDNSGSHQISYLHTDSLKLYIGIIIDSNHIADLRFNGDSTIFSSNLFQRIHDSVSLACGRLRVDQFLTTDSVMTITCDSGKFILFVDESDSARGASFTCLTDYVPCSYLQFNMESAYCVGDSIVFDCAQNDMDSLVLHGPNGVVCTSLPYVIPFADTTMSGQYIIEGFNYDGRHLPYYDTINIIVNLSLSDTICDTINETQLPWERFGIEFMNDVDTIIYQDIPTSNCDSVHYYHLRIGHNSHDTAIFYICPSEMPMRYDTIWIYGDTVCDYHHVGSLKQDSIITIFLHVLEDSDTSIFDTIVDSQLPWSFMGIPFEDTVNNYLIYTFNEQGCDSVIHYSLYIYWNGDHCDTTLTYPNFVTPNGDGTNDKFIIGGLLENECFKYSDLSIYDRTGRRVYHKSNIANESDWWDPAADRIPAGTYFYYFRAHGVNIHTQHKGVIEVLREK